MRILNLTSAFPHSPDDPGSSFILHQASELADLVDVIDVAELRGMRRGSAAREDFEMNGVRGLHAYRYLTAPTSVSLTLRALGARPQLGGLRRLLRREEYDAALVHDELVADLVIPLLRQAELPWVLVVHGISFNRRMQSPAGVRLRERAYRQANRIVLTGPGVRVPHWASDKASLVPNGAEYLPADGPPPTRTAPIMALSVGRLISSKGVHLNIEALAEVRRCGLDIGYWVVGDGPEKRALERLATSLGVRDYVVFTGQVSRNRLGSYFEWCNFFSLVSRPEAYGIAYVEAMLHGKPAIACRGEGPESFIEQDVSGLLVERESSALGDCWKTLVEDVGLRASLGANALEVARTRTWRVNAERIVKLLQEATHRNP